MKPYRSPHVIVLAVLAIAGVLLGLLLVLIAANIDTESIILGVDTRAVRTQATLYSVGGFSLLLGIVSIVGWFTLAGVERAFRKIGLGGNPTNT